MPRQSNAPINVFSQRGVGVAGIPWGFDQKKSLPPGIRQNTLT